MMGSDDSLNKLLEIAISVLNFESPKALTRPPDAVLLVIGDSGQPTVRAATGVL